MTAAFPSTPLPHLWFRDPLLSPPQYLEWGNRWIRHRAVTSGLWLVSAVRMHHPMDQSDDDVAGEIASGFTGLDDQVGREHLPGTLLRLANGPGGSVSERLADCDPMPTTVIIDGAAHLALRLDFGGPLGLAITVDDAWILVLAQERGTYDAVHLVTVPTPPPPPVPVQAPRPPPGRYWTGGSRGTVARWDPPT